DRNHDGDLRTRPDPHEIDVQWRIADRMVLDIARQGAMRRPVDADVDERREEPGPRHDPGQRARIEADQHRLLLVAIDDPGNAPAAPRRPRRALAGAGARLGTEADDLGHDFLLLPRKIDRP